MRTLLIGIGNTLREDDAAGPETVRRFAELYPGLPDLGIVIEQQVMPEHAAMMAEVARVILVDCRVGTDAPGSLRVEKLDENEKESTGTTMDHTMTVNGVLQLCKTLYGHVPETWQVTITGSQFGLSEQVSEEVEKAIPAVVETILEIVKK